MTPMRWQHTHTLTLTNVRTGAVQAIRLMVVHGAGYTEHDTDMPTWRHMADGSWWCSTLTLNPSLWAADVIPIANAPCESGSSPPVCGGCRGARIIGDAPCPMCNGEGVRRAGGL